jgi:SAM-dependent methyltransferase
MIEDVRRFWDRQPCNINHGRLADLKTNPYLYSAQVTAKKYRVEPHIPEFAQFSRWAGWDVLDLGCGIGTDTLSFAREGARVTGVDISRESLCIARKRVTAEGMGASVNLVQQDIENLDVSRWNLITPLVHRYGQCYFDLIYSFGAIHHTPNPRLAIESARKHVKDTGEFRFMVYNRHSWKALWILMHYGHGQFWKMDELIPRYSEAHFGCPITWTFTPKEIYSLLEGQFRVHRMYVDHIFPYRVSDYVRGLYTKEWYWRLMPPRLFRWLESRIGWHLMVVARPV